MKGGDCTVAAPSVPGGTNGGGAWIVAALSGGGGGIVCPPADIACGGGGGELAGDIACGGGGGGVPAGAGIAPDCTGGIAPEIGKIAESDSWIDACASGGTFQPDIVAC
jgi:hypothetical protein